MNCILLFDILSFNFLVRTAVITVLAVAFIYYNILPGTDKSSPLKQRVLTGGCELITAFLSLFIFHTVFYVFICLSGLIRVPTLIINGIFSCVIVFTLALNGYIRIFVTSKQLGTRFRICMIFLWWLPIANLVFLGITCKVAKKEYKFLHNKYLLNKSRKEQEICKTKYPILMLHGIFFRDWKYFNYWGRIPEQLISNGAQIFYGNHHSSLPVERTAEEIKQRILKIVEETGCGKVNIIAHSKGGLDARYAVSCLGMDAHVASITTINTPHRGSALAETLLDNSPEKLISSVGRRYKAIFTKLGDNDCDFFGSVSGLTAKRCAELNEIMPNREGILYQSVGSALNGAASTVPPLALGFLITKSVKGDTDNDGLVCTDSMAWGDFLGVLRSSWKKGISHGDMVDLMKKNIPDFDVCEFYVDLVKTLKEKGL